MTTKYNMWSSLDLEHNNHLIKKCRYCQAEIVWLKSKKGKYYPVNFNGLVEVHKTDFHKCNR
jgi:hypothetical protein